MLVPEGFWLHFFGGGGGDYFSILYFDCSTIVCFFLTIKYLSQRPIFYDIDLCLFMENFHRHENIGDLFHFIAPCFTDNKLSSTEENVY